MSRAMSSHRVLPASAPADVTEVIFKRDRPREIDRYIDYFGDSGRDVSERPETEPREISSSPFVGSGSRGRRL